MTIDRIIAVITAIAVVQVAIEHPKTVLTLVLLALLVAYPELAFVFLLIGVLLYV